MPANATRSSSTGSIGSAARRRIAKTLNKRSILTRGGRLWHDITVKHRLATPWQVGARVADGELVFGGNMEPIVPLEVFQVTMAAMEARKLQLRRFQEAERRRDAAVRRSEAAVRSSHVEDVLSSLTAVGLDGWAVLSLEAKRDIFDIVLDRVFVYPKENPRGRGQGPHKIKVLWR